jgi:glucose-6-phosphate isomerase
MSEPTITKVEKTQKPKDPKRVESGKRLAAISKEAKAKRAAERRSAESNSDQGDSVNTLIYIGVVTAALGGIYYIYSKTTGTRRVRW